MDFCTLTIPHDERFLISAARVPRCFLETPPAPGSVGQDGSALVDLLVERGRIADISSAPSQSPSKARVSTWPAAMCGRRSPICMLISKRAIRSPEAPIRTGLWPVR